MGVTRVSRTDNREHKGRALVSGKHGPCRVRHHGPLTTPKAAGHATSTLQDVEQTTRFKKKVEKDDMYMSSVIQLGAVSTEVLQLGVVSGYYVLGCYSLGSMSNGVLQPRVVSAGGCYG